MNAGTEATWKPPIFKYALSLAGRVQSKNIGTNPSGTLVDVDYTSLAVFTKDPPPASLPIMDAPWAGITGRVVAGSDWATLRTDGVVEFNGRLTMQTEEKDSDGKPTTGLLINVVLSGVVDLLTACKAETSGDRELLLQKWSKDSNGAGVASLNLGVCFELAQASEPWAAKEYPQRGFEKYVQLVQSPFLASGTATLNGGLLSNVQVDILQIVAS